MRHYDEPHRGGRPPYFVFLLQSVRGIEEHNVCLDLRQDRGGPSMTCFGSVLDPERAQILANNPDRSAALLDEHGPRGAPAQRLDAHGAGPGVRVGEDRSRDAGRQHVEQRLAQAIRRRAHVETRKALERTAAELTTNDAHMDTACLRTRLSICSYRSR